MPVSAAYLDTIGARPAALHACWVKHRSLVYDTSEVLNKVVHAAAHAAKCGE